MLSRLAHPVVLAWGWRRAVIAFLAGALGVLALEPFGFWPAMLVSFTVLAWLIDGAASGRWRGSLAGAAIGWCFGFGYFLAGFYWVGYAFLVDAKTFGWLLPVAVCGLPAYTALYTAFGVALARLLWTPGPQRILTLAATLTLSEWLRGHLLTGFPWNAFGYGLTSPLALAQAASLTGLWGLTFIAVAVFASPATLADERKASARPWLAPALAGLVLVALAGYGEVRLHRTPQTFVNNVKLRIMQPNLQQDEKFNYNARASVMERYLALSDRATGPQNTGVADVTDLIWPESAFPFFLSREPEAMAQIANLLPPGTLLITGAARPGEPDADGHIRRAYNSVYVIDHDGTILSIYDKVHLVPFGEYLPLQSLLEALGLQQLTKIQGGFIAGDRHRPVPLPNAPPFLPLVCYEIVFPGDIPRGAERPDWLVNLTNDAWFGISAGPYQHFQQARVRAIEEGLPLVRAANDGISAVTDPLGRIVSSLPLGVEGVLDARLPTKLPPTPYARTGDWPVAILSALVLAAALVRRRRETW